MLPGDPHQWQKTDIGLHPPPGLVMNPSSHDSFSSFVPSGTRDGNMSIGTFYNQIPFGQGQTTPFHNSARVTPHIGYSQDYFPSPKPFLPTSARDTLPANDPSSQIMPFVKHTYPFNHRSPIDFYNIDDNFITPVPTNSFTAATDAPDEMQLFTGELRVQYPTLHFFINSFTSTGSESRIIIGVSSEQKPGNIMSATAGLSTIFASSTGFCGVPQDVKNILYTDKQDEMPSQTALFGAGDVLSIHVANLPSDASHLCTIRICQNKNHELLSYNIPPGAPLPSFIFLILLNSSISLVKENVLSRFNHKGSVMDVLAFHSYRNFIATETRLVGSVFQSVLDNPPPIMHARPPMPQDGHVAQNFGQPLVQPLGQPLGTPFLQSRALHTDDNGAVFPKNDWTSVSDAATRSMPLLEASGHALTLQPQGLPPDAGFASPFSTKISRSATNDSADMQTAPGDQRLELKFQLSNRDSVPIEASPLPFQGESEVIQSISVDDCQDGGPLRGPGLFDAARGVGKESRRGTALQSINCAVFSTLAFAEGDTHDPRDSSVYLGIVPSARHSSGSVVLTMCYLSAHIVRAVPAHILLPLLLSDGKYVKYLHTVEVSPSSSGFVQLSVESSRPAASVQGRLGAGDCLGCRFRLLSETLTLATISSGMSTTLAGYTRKIPLLSEAQAVLKQNGVADLFSVPPAPPAGAADPSGGVLAVMMTNGLVYVLSDECPAYAAVLQEFETTTPQAHAGSIFMSAAAALNTAALAEHIKNHIDPDLVQTGDYVAGIHRYEGSLDVKKTLRWRRNCYNTFGSVTPDHRYFAIDSPGFAVSTPLPLVGADCGITRLSLSSGCSAQLVGLLDLERLKPTCARTANNHTIGHVRMRALLAASSPAAAGGSRFLEMLARLKGQLRADQYTMLVRAIHAELDRPQSPVRTVCLRYILLHYMQGSKLQTRRLLEAMVGLLDNGVPAWELFEPLVQTPFAGRLLYVVYHALDRDRTNAAGRRLLTFYVDRRFVSACILGATAAPPGLCGSVTGFLQGSLMVSFDSAVQMSTQSNMTVAQSSCAFSPLSTKYMGLLPLTSTVGFDAVRSGSQGFLSSTKGYSNIRHWEAYSFVGCSSNYSPGEVNAYLALADNNVISRACADVYDAAAGTIVYTADGAAEGAAKNERNLVEDVFKQYGASAASHCGVHRVPSECLTGRALDADVYTGHEDAPTNPYFDHDDHAAAATEGAAAVAPGAPADDEDRDSARSLSVHSCSSSDDGVCSPRERRVDRYCARSSVAADENVKWSTRINRIYQRYLLDAYDPAVASGMTSLAYLRSAVAPTLDHYILTEDALNALLTEACNDYSLVFLYFAYEYSFVANFDIRTLVDGLYRHLPLRAFVDGLGGCLDSLGAGSPLTHRAFPACEYRTFHNFSAVKYTGTSRAYEHAYQAYFKQMADSLISVFKTPNLGSVPTCDPYPSQAVRFDRVIVPDAGDLQQFYNLSNHPQLSQVVQGADGPAAAYLGMKIRKDCLFVDATDIPSVLLFSEMLPTRPTSSHCLKVVIQFRSEYGSGGQFMIDRLSQTYSYARFNTRQTSKHEGRKRYLELDGDERLTLILDFRQMVLFVFVRHRKETNRTATDLRIPWRLNWPVRFVLEISHGSAEISTKDYNS